MMDKRLKPFRHKYYGAFLPAANFVLDHEGWGRESDHPADLGDRTRFGISARHHGQVPLTLARALEIYFQDYWLPIKGESLPPLLNLALFDSAVLCGSRKAVQWLQLSINEWWQGWEMEEPGVDFGVSHNKLAVDGVVGPRTLAAVNEVMAARDYDDRAYDYGHRYLINRIIWRRQIHHAKRVKLHPDQANWIHGWTKRCADLAKATWGKN